MEIKRITMWRWYRNPLGVLVKVPIFYPSDKRYAHWFKLRSHLKLKVAIKNFSLKNSDGNFMFRYQNHMSEDINQ